MLFTVDVKLSGTGVSTVELNVSCDLDQAAFTHSAYSGGFFSYLYGTCTR